MEARLILKSHVKGYTKTVNGKPVAVREHDDKRTKKPKTKLVVRRKSNKYKNEGEYFKRLSPDQQQKLIVDTWKVDEAKSLHFADVADPKVIAAGDALLLNKKTSGYNVTLYDAVPNSLVDKWKGDGKGVNWSYSMYTAHPEHVRDFVAAARLKKIDAPVSYHIKASAVFVRKINGEYEWGADEEAKRDEVEGGAIDRTVECTLVFNCKNDDEAKALEELSKEIADMHGKPEKEGTPEEERKREEHNGKQIPYSWFAPDRRASKPVKGMHEAVMNVKDFGKQSLVVLQAYKPVEGFAHSKIWLGDKPYGIVAANSLKALDFILSIEARLKSVLQRKSY